MVEGESAAEASRGQRSSQTASAGGWRNQGTRQGQGCGLLKDQLCLYFIAKLVLSRGEEL